MLRLMRGLRWASGFTAGRLYAAGGDPADSTTPVFTGRFCATTSYSYNTTMLSNRTAGWFAAGCVLSSLLALPYVVAKDQRAGHPATCQTQIGIVARVARVPKPGVRSGLFGQVHSLPHCVARYERGAKKITQTPTNAISAPAMSYLSGWKPSTFQAHNRASTIKMPP